MESVEEKQDTTLDSLPLELLWLCCEQLDTSSTVALLLCNKQLYEMLSHEQLWRRLYKLDWKTVGQQLCCQNYRKLCIHLNSRFLGKRQEAAIALVLREAADELICLGLLPVRFSGWCVSSLEGECKGFAVAVRAEPESYRLRSRQQCIRSFQSIRFYRRLLRVLDPVRWEARCCFSSVSVWKRVPRPFSDRLPNEIVRGLRQGLCDCMVESMHSFINSLDLLVTDWSRYSTLHRPGNYLDKTWMRVVCNMRCYSRGDPRLRGWDGESGADGVVVVDSLTEIYSPTICTVPLKHNYISRKMTEVVRQALQESGCLVSVTTQLGDYTCISVCITNNF